MNLSANIFVLVILMAIIRSGWPNIVEFPTWSNTQQRFNPSEYRLHISEVGACNFVFFNLFHSFKPSFFFPRRSSPSLGKSDHVVLFPLAFQLICREKNSIVWQLLIIPVSVKVFFVMSIFAMPVPFVVSKISLGRT